MKRIAFLIAALIITFSGLQVKVEANSQVVLKTPSLDEYLATTQTVLNEASTLSELRSSLVSMAQAEFIYRYLSEANYLERRQAFDILKVEFGFTPVSYPAIDLDQWIAWILDAWFAENSVNLDSIQELRFDDFDATIEQRDFNNDGMHEWLLDLTKGADGDDFEYRNWIVIARVGNTYDAIPVPLWPGYHGSWDFPSAYAWQPGEGEFVDITADGIPEWFFGQSVTPWGIPPNHSYQESILSWRNGRIVNLMPDANTVFKSNLDDDPALELIQSYSARDSWRCVTISETVYDWNGTEFVALEQPVIEKQNCTAREAEEAMWQGDIQTALVKYNAFLAAYSGEYTDFIRCLEYPRWGVECGSDSWFNHMGVYSYFLARRVIAYALLRDEQHVRTSLEGLKALARPDSFSLAILAVNSADPEKICRAAYDFFASRKTQYYSYNLPISLFTPGEAIEDVDSNSYAINYYGHDIDPIKAGCDITVFSPQPTPTPTATPSPMPTYTPYPTPNPEQKLVWENPASYFRKGDYETTLWIAEHADQRVRFEPDDALEMLYWRALAQEALGREQEAAASYRELAQTAPGTVWAKLADLHFECMTDC